MNINREQTPIQYSRRDIEYAANLDPQNRKTSWAYADPQTARQNYQSRPTMRHVSPPSRPVIGIALGAGAARGWAHIGILKALKKAGISPDVVAGTSIGAVAGGCYVASKLEALETFATDLSLRRIFSYLDFNIKGGGLISGNRLHEMLGKHLDHQPIETFAKRFVAIATELKSGKEVWLEKGPITKAVRASYALPGIFKPVYLNGQWLTDGALVNPIPVSACRALGAQFVIAVNLNGGEAEKYKTGMECNELKDTESTPGIKSVMYNAFNISMTSITNARLAADQPDLTIQPKLGSIGMFDFHRAKEAIVLGERAVKSTLREIKQSWGKIDCRAKSSCMAVLS